MSGKDIADWLLKIEAVTGRYQAQSVGQLLLQKDVIRPVDDPDLVDFKDSSSAFYTYTGSEGVHSTLCFFLGGNKIFHDFS